MAFSHPLGAALTATFFIITSSAVAESTSPDAHCIPGEYIAVVHQDDAPPMVSETVLGTPFGNSKVLKEYKNLSRRERRVMHVALPQSIDPRALYSSSDSRVELYPNCLKSIAAPGSLSSFSTSSSADPQNNRINTYAVQPPTDTLFVQQWGLNNSGQDGGMPGIDVAALQAWEVTKGDPEVIVAVLDNGIDYDHPDLAPNMWHNNQEIPGNFRDDDANGYVDDMFGADTLDIDGDPRNDPIAEPPTNADFPRGHGTHVAGTIAALENGAGVVGVAPEVRIMAVRALGIEGGTDASILDGLSYILSMRRRNVNVRVVNMSLGGEQPCTRPYLEAFAALDAEGVIVVAAAGNGGVDGRGDNIDVYPVTPASCASKNLISVANISRTGALSSTSNFGTNSVDVAAPGTDIWSTFPNLTLARQSGTSMAAPHVSGALALLFSREPGLSPEAARLRVMETVQPLSNLQGIMNAPGIVNTARLLSSSRTLSLAVQYSTASVTARLRNGKVALKISGKLSDAAARVRQAQLLVTYARNSYRIPLRVRYLGDGFSTLTGSSRLLAKSRRTLVAKFLVLLNDGTELSLPTTKVRISSPNDQPQLFDYTGTWSGDFNRRSTTCQTSSPGFSFVHNIAQNRATITLREISDGGLSLKGKADAAGFNVHAQSLVNGCLLRAAIHYSTPSSAALSNVSANLELDCGSAGSCVAVYAGQARR